MPLDIRLLAFDFTSSIEKRVSQKRISFYSYLLKLVHNKTFNKTGINTIPVLESLRLNKTDILKEILTGHISDIDFSSSDTLNQQVVIIDICKIQREGLVFPLSIGLSNFLKDTSGFGSVIIYSDSLTFKFLNSPDFPSFLPIQDLVVKDKIIVFSDDGETSSRRVAQQLDKVDFRNTLSKSFPSNEKLLSMKLIKRLGHFHRNEMFQNEYFDGSFCKKEIYFLLRDLIEKELKSTKIDLLLFYSKESPWLVEPAYMLGYDLNPTMGAQDISKIELKDYAKKVKSKVILINDLINTGNTLIGLLQDLSDSMKLSKNQLFVVSVLNNSAFTSNRKKRFIQVPRMGKVDISYLLDINYTQSPDNKCIQCKINLPIDDYTVDKFDQIKTFDFWSLANLSNYKKEDNVPKSRKKKPVDYLPNLNTIFDKEFTPFFVFKFGNYISNLGININNITVVLPNEAIRSEPTSTKFEDTSSGRFAICLNEIYEIDYIAVPRLVIEDFSIIDSSPDEIWYRQLQSVSGNLFIVDEIYVSGSTYKGLKKVVKRFNKDITGYFPILNLNPRHFKSIKDEDNGPQVCFSLYDLDLN